MYTKLMKSVDAKGIQTSIFCQHKCMIFSCCHLRTLMTHQAFYQSRNLRQMKKKMSPSMFQATSLFIRRFMIKNSSKITFKRIILCVSTHPLSCRTPCNNTVITIQVFVEKIKLSQYTTKPLLFLKQYNPYTLETD